MMLRTTVAGLALTLAACSTDRPAATIEGHAPTTSTSGTPVTAVQLRTERLVGSWRVVTAETGAAFAVGDLLTFLGDGTFLFDGPTDGGGTWNVALLSTLVIGFRGVKHAFTVREGSIAEDGVGVNGGELRLDGDRDLSLTRVRGL